MDKLEPTQGCERELRVFNEIWLDVQGRFIQDHQDIDRATREDFKFVWIKKP